MNNSKTTNPLINDNAAMNWCVLAVVACVHLLAIYWIYRLPSPVEHDGEWIEFVDLMPPAPKTPSHTPDNVKIQQLDNQSMQLPTPSSQLDTITPQNNSKAITLKSDTPKSELTQPNTALPTQANQSDTFKPITNIDNTNNTNNTDKAMQDKSDIDKSDIDKSFVAQKIKPATTTTNQPASQLPIADRPTDNISDTSAMNVPKQNSHQTQEKPQASNMQAVGQSVGIQPMQQTQQSNTLSPSDNKPNRPTANQKGASADNPVQATANLPKVAYPALSEENQEEGVVILSVLVAPNGKVEQVQIIQSSGFLRLDNAAKHAAKKGQFKTAVWTNYRIVIEFVL